MSDGRGARNRMRREKVDAPWRDDRDWTSGIIYVCREDPRVIVRNRFSSSLSASGVPGPPRTAASRRTRPEPDPVG